MADAKKLSTAFAHPPSGLSAGLFSAVVIAVLSGGVVVPSSVQADDRAHAIADQFAGASAASKSADRARPPHDPLKSYEDEMLARAREEALARAKADLAAAEEKAARERAAAAAAATKAADQAKAEAQAKAAAQHGAAASADDEARALSERLRAAREAHEAKMAAEREAAAAAQRAAAEAEARSAALAAAEAKKREASLAMARARIAERTRRLAEKVETARTVRLASEAAVAREANIDHKRVAHPDGAREVAAGDGTVTVLIVMDAGTRGIRRWNKTADPMLCVDETCYISRGAATAAKRIARSKAFGPGIALGERAGDCRNKLVCAFRGVKLENGRSWMQPIDLRIMRHDRREAKLVVADPTCSVTAGKLACTRTVTSGDYRAWIVPEPLAERAGAKAIEAALVAELPAR